MADVVLTEQEFRALSAIVREYALMRRDDIIGAFYLTGGFRVISDETICELADRVGKAEPIR